MKRRLGVSVVIVVVIALLVPLTALAASVSPRGTGSTCQTFEQTGFQTCGEFLTYWNANGGLPVFGYPLTDAHDEVNSDTGGTYSVQYFERQRFELHPENAGTVYNVLLGRIGAQILELQGRDWTTFPKADPSAAHYMEATGHAIAPEFYDYWSSHGLDYGDPGVSFRESLLLFGYPISEPAMETNSDNDTVLTQWFERAVFEYHPNNNDPYKVLLRRVGAEVLDAMTPPQPSFDVIATGLNGPRGIAVADDGTVYVAESGVGGEMCAQLGEGDNPLSLCYGETGAITKIDSSGQSHVAEHLPSMTNPEGTSGPHDVIIGDDGMLYFVVGLGTDPANRDASVAEAGTVAENMGSMYSLAEDGTITKIADISAYETSANPEPSAVDSNPYSLVSDGDGWIVADAGANDLIQVSADGQTLSTAAVFGPQMQPGPGGVTIPADAVPTGVVKGPDGAYYVGELTGFPFAKGSARVWRVVPGEEPEVYASGFTNIIDVAFDSAGNLYVLEITTNGLAEAEATGQSTSALVRVAPDGTKTTVMTDGLVMPTGMAIGPDGSIYISNFGVMPGMGQVIRVHP